MTPEELTKRTQALEIRSKNHLVAIQLKLEEGDDINDVRESATQWVEDESLKAEQKENEKQEEQQVADNLIYNDMKEEITKEVISTFINNLNNVVNSSVKEEPKEDKEELEKPTE